MGEVDPRLLIQSELSERVRRNPRYSLRAFARSSGVSHTVLSLVLSGKRPLSKKAASRLADFLDLDPERRLELVNASGPRRGKTVRVPKNRVGGAGRMLSLDLFSVIADWQHLAILSALELPNAKLEPAWIAKKLGLTQAAAKLAIDRLKRLELVEKSSSGSWKQSGKPIRMSNTESTVATRTFHKQLLARATESLESDPIAVRDFSSMTLAMTPAAVPYARERVREFRRELTAELEAFGAPTAVYQLLVQVFPVTKNE